MQLDNWCCLTCFWKGLFQDLMTTERCPNLHCPTCGSHELDPIDGKYVMADNYTGHEGTVH